MAEAALSVGANIDTFLEERGKRAASRAAAKFKASKGPTMTLKIPPKVAADMAKKAKRKMALKSAVKFGAKPLSAILDAKEVFDLATDPKAREDAKKMVEQMSKESPVSRAVAAIANPANTAYGIGSALGDLSKTSKGAKDSASNYQKLVAIAAHTEEKFPRTEGVKRTRKEQEKIAAYRQQLQREVTVVPGRKKSRGRPAITSSIKFPDGSSRPFVDPKTYKPPRNKSFAEKEADKARARGDTPVR